MNYKILSILIICLILMLSSDLKAASKIKPQGLAKKEADLTILTNNNPYSNVLLNSFSKKHPEIKIKRLIYVAPAYNFDFDKIFVSENSDDRIDVFFAGQSRRVNKWITKNYLADLTNLSNWKLRPNYHIDHKKIIYLLPTPHGVAFNKKKISLVEIPKTYDEFLDKKWDGQIGIRHPHGGSTPQYLIHFIHSSKGNLDWYRKLGSNHVRVYSNVNDMYKDLEDGKIKLALSRDMEVMNQTQFKHFKNLEFSLVKEKALFHYQFAGMSAKAPHIETAQLFLNWILKDGHKFLDSNGFISKYTKIANKTPEKIWYIDYNTIDYDIHEKIVLEAEENLKNGGAKFIDNKNEQLYPDDEQSKTHNQLKSIGLED